MSSSIKDIFLDALDVPAADRAAWLARECPDAATRERVLALLAAHDVAPTFAPPRPSSLGLGAAPPPVEDVGDAIGENGKYELVRRLGEGGFGVVFLARQRFPVERPVAIKLLKVAHDGSQIAARFEAERQTLARMDHPLIARVYDAGTTARGRPFFAMEYVDGPPITDFCYARKMILVERLELFAQVCNAIQYAHSRGVIHRDLKPGNMLVSVVDGKPMATVIDFGIAKAVDPLTLDGAAPAPQMTLEAQIIGTPQYMAPEQATLGRKHVDARSDVYSLGAVLYELVASTPPFDLNELRQAGLDEVCRIVRDRTPTRPSTRIATDPTRTQLHRTRLSRLVAGEVDWIVLRAMEKEPDRRYQTAAELAEDLRRFIRHEPIRARPPSRLYAARKFVRRNRPEVALASLALASLLGVAVVATVKEREARGARDLARQNETTAVANAARARDAEARAIAERDVADAQLARADAIATFARQMLGGIGPSVARGRDTGLLKDVLDVAVRGLDPSLATRAPTIDLSVRTMIAQAEYDLGDFDRAVRTLRPAFDASTAAAADGAMRDAPERLRAGTLLTTILSESGRPDEALAIAKQGVDGYARAGDAASNESLSARIAMASALRRSRRFDEAEWVDENVLAQLVADDRGDDDLALLVRNSIASILVDLHRPADALARWEDVLAIQQRRYGANHPGTLATMSNLAYVYAQTGQAEKAERFDRLVLEGERRLYEPGHPNVVRTLNNLTAVLLLLGRVDDAQATLDEANAIVAAKPDSMRRFARPLLAQTAELRARQGRFDEAIALSTQLRDAAAQDLGPRAAQTIAAGAQLVGCLADAGRTAEANAAADALDVDRLPAELSDDQRVAIHAAVASARLAAGRVDDARREATLARALLSGDATENARLTRVERALAVATTQVTTQP